MSIWILEAPSIPPVLGVPSSWRLTESIAKVHPPFTPCFGGRCVALLCCILISRVQFVAIHLEHSQSSTNFSLSSLACGYLISEASPVSSAELNGNGTLVERAAPVDHTANTDILTKSGVNCMIVEDAGCWEVLGIGS